MRILSFKQSACICTVAICIGLIFAVAGSGRVFADESLDQLLSSAMEKNPEIVTAKAKVALAEAELNAIRMKVANQIISQRNALEKQRNIVKIDKETYGKGTGTTFKELQENDAKLKELETELNYLSGLNAIAGVQEKDSPISQDSLREAKSPEPPTGPVAEKYTKKFFTQATKCEFVDTPLSQVMDFLKSYHGMEFVMDKKILAEAGTPDDLPITMDLKDVPLYAALQFLEDQNQGQHLQFVLRDYGILLTTVDQAKAQGYYPLLEYAKSLGTDIAPEVHPGPQTYNPEPKTENPPAKR
jgi:hypothetical protein